MGLKDLSTGLKDLFKRKRKRAPPPAPSPPPLPSPQPLIPRPPLLRPPPPPYSPSPPPPPPPPPPPSFTPSPLPPPSLPLTPPRPQPLPRPQRRPTPRPQRQSFPPVPTTRPRKPVAPNPATGRYSSYYSTWATQARNPGTNETEKQDHSLCECCKKRPKFKDATKVHPYCGLTCAKHAASTRNNLITPPGPSSDQTCRTPGCKFPVHVYPDGTSSNYCMIAHKEWGARGCISCRAAPMSSTSVLCQSCHNDALSKAPTIIEVPDDHDNYMSEGQFKRSWRHKTTCPEVMAIHKIIVTETSLRQYQQYQDSVESRGNFSTKGKYRGNEHRRWHGTRRKCNLGDQECNTFCADPGCSLCSIIKSSFDVKFFKTATGWGRFGHGIYTSSTSSKSNDYSKNIGINSDRKALLLNKVIVGNGKKYSQNNTSLTQPPPGYDSVIAEVVPGGTLNYDELVVYNNDAVRPSYLVMYKSP